MDEINNDNGLTTDVKYRPVYYHWFYEIVEDLAKTQWTPFSMKDSMALEEAMAKSRASNFLVPTDGGRYDVSLSERKRIPIYWNGLPNAVRRCSWFYKALDSHFVPYEESTAEKLEEQYCEAFRTGKWQKKILLENGETIVFHGPSVIVHFLHSQTADSWTGTQATNRPRVVKRGIDHFNIEDGESDQIDHLVFMIHGIGKACDLKFRTIEEAVNEFRNISNQLVQAHYRNSCDLGIVNRVEVLPVSWHVELHSEEFGIDEKLKLITLQSIPKLRGFANETLLDILFYSSPKFCQTIISIVGNQLNNLIHVFKERNPNFKGGISLGGHSLGSLILFDLLSHQTDDCNGTEPQSLEQQNSVNTIGGGTGQPFINYPQLAFKIKNFFALGSPISMFVTVRGISELGQNYRLPTCEGFFNIFHPYDPVAYRFEPLIYPEMSKVNPVLIPHHKGRKRMHLELKETMHRVGTDLKQRIVCTFQNTMQAVYSLTTNKQIIDQAAIEDEVNKALENQLNQSIIDRSECVSETSETDQRETELQLGQMNKSRRIDYMLQESVLEYCNEYLFALTSHVCYWESEDTILFMMKEIYSSMGVSTDSQIPQHTLKIERLTGDQNSSIK
ncbi:SEC23-interacting protein isoform X2 [Culicoides brevitarsis]